MPDEMKRRRLEQWALYQEKSVSPVDIGEIPSIDDETLKSFTSDIENYLKDSEPFAPSITQQPDIEWELDAKEDGLPSLSNFSAYKKWFGKLIDYSVWTELRDLLQDARFDDQSEE